MTEQQKMPDGSMKKPKFLIIGAGMIGHVHAGALKKLGLPFDVCDPKEDFAKDLQARYGAETCYTDYREAAALSDADCAVICTPNHLHAAPAVCAMENGMDVLCEKPLASSAAQAKEIYDAQKRTGRFLMVGYIVRCYPALDKVREILSSGITGPVISARCVLAAPETLDVAKTPYRKSYETGGGIIYDYTHEIDYMRLLLGEPVMGAAMVGCYLNRDRSADDSADMLLRFDSGVQLQLHMDYIQWKGHGGGGRSFELVCEKGTLECDFHTVTVSLNNGQCASSSFDLAWEDNFVTQMRRFLRARSGEDIPYASAESGYRTLCIADKLYESAASNTFVFF